MNPAQYQQKFSRIAEQTSYRLLAEQDRDFLRRQAAQYRFSLQELQLVSDIALDRMRWKESALSEVWPQSEGTGDTRAVKKSLLLGLRQQHDALKSKSNSYAAITVEDKPKTRKPDLAVQVKPGLGLGRCPVASEKTRCCNLLTLDAVEKCGFDCSYCSIQSFYHGNKVTFNAGFAEQLKQLKLDPDKTYHIGTGQSSDSLMWGNHQGVLDALAEFAADNPNVVLELKTKSKNIGWLLQNDYPENIICTWSLNPQTIIDHEEHLSASLEQRLVSAEKIAEKGRLVGFHFHPIVHYEHWRNDYLEICNDIVKRFSANQVAMVSMGTLTFTRSVMKTIRQRPLTSKILQMPMEEIAGKFSYPIDTKVDLFKTLYDALEPWHNKVFYYLCMEAQSLWQPVFGYEFDSNLALESAMKSAYFDKIQRLAKV